MPRTSSILLTALGLALLPIAPTATLRAQDKGKVAMPFNGKDLTGWRLKGDAEKAKAKSKWTVAKASVDPSKPNALVTAPGDGELVNSASGGVDIYTDEKWGDCTIELEF